MSTVTLFSLHIILLKSLKNQISLLFSIIFHRPYVYPDDGTPIFLLRLYPHFPPSFQLYCPMYCQSAGIRISRLTFTVELGIKEKRQPLQEEIFFLTGWMRSCFFYMFISVCVHLLCSLPRWLLQVHGFFFLLGELCISPAQHYVLSYYIYSFIYLYPCVDTGCLTPYTLCIDCVCCSELL